MMPGKLQVGEITRYIINGLLATAVHFSVLTLNLEVLKIPSAGLANMLAAVFGISTSFFGSRFFVFKEHTGSLASQAAKFASLYVFIAILHGGVLYGWTDVAGLNYRIGFVLATFMQIAFSYVGNKTLVFKT
jgi:putative flippase GtrA